MGHSHQAVPSATSNADFAPSLKCRVPENTQKSRVIWNRRFAVETAQSERLGTGSLKFCIWVHVGKENTGLLFGEGLVRGQGRRNSKKRSFGHSIDT